MTLTERLTELVRACFTGIWIESHEHHDALAELATLCRDEEWRLLSWNIETGLSSGGDAPPQESGSDPLAAIRAAGSLSGDTTTILVLQNFHRFLQSAEIVQAMSRQIIAGNQTRTIMVVLSPIVQIPVELEKMFMVVEHALPDREQLLGIAQGIATEEGELPDECELETVIDAAAGLTRMEAENAFSLSLVRNGSIASEAIWELKTQTLKNSGLLSLYRGGSSFHTLGGLSALKSFCKRALQHAGSDPLKQARGVMLLSPPGCGKSQFAKSLGREVNRPVLALDVGKLMGSLVGQSEERTRKALQIVDAMAPCVLMVDEIEKAFAGLGGGNDSGVSARMFGSFIQWLNDHSSDVFVVCTSNDISKLPPELGRSERFDGIFFLDLPNRDEKDVIWDIYLDVFELDRKQPLADDLNWTGAEIKSCCRLAALLDLTLEEAAQNIVPVAVTAAESIEKLRNWANGRCLAADRPGIYRHGGHSGGNARRHIPRDPSLN